MAAFSVWLNPLTSRIPGATPEQLQAELIAAAQDFYIQSRAWNVTLGPFDFTVSTPAVTLATGDVNSRVTWIRNAWLQYGDLTEDLGPLIRRVPSANEDHPRNFYRDPNSPGVIYLWPTPNATETGVVYANVALQPTENATTLPDQAEIFHFEAILDAAMGRILKMPNKPWTDPIASMAHARSARRAAMEFRAVADAGYTHADPGWRFPPFA